MLPILSITVLLVTDLTPSPRWCSGPPLPQPAGRRLQVEGGGFEANQRDLHEVCKWAGVCSLPTPEVNTEGPTGLRQGHGESRVHKSNWKDGERVFKAHMWSKPAYQQRSPYTSSPTTIPARMGVHLPGGASLPHSSDAAMKPRDTTPWKAARSGGAATGCGISLIVLRPLCWCHSFPKNTSAQLESVSVG